MTDLLVDPIILALPGNNRADDSHIEYVKHLALWSEEVRIGRHNFFVSETCVLALYDSASYPSQNGLHALWTRVGEQALGCHDAFAACQRLLMNVPYLEDRIGGLRDVLVDDQHTQVRPDLLERLHEPVARAFSETLGYVAYARMVKQDVVARDMMLVTHPIAGGPSAEIHARLEENTRSIKADAEVPLITSPDELLDLMELAEFWRETKRAIDWVIDRMVRSHLLPSGICLASYEVAPDFNESILAYNCHNRPDQLNQVFRKCVLLLADQIPYGVTHHALGGHKQRRARGWSAYRLHITGGSLALRLHYWRRGGRIILMQIGPHEDYCIADPPEEYD